LAHTLCQTYGMRGRGMRIVVGVVHPRRGYRGRVVALVMSLTLVLASTGALAQVKLTPFRPEISFDFENSRDEQTRSIRLDMSDTATGTPSAAVLGDFVSTDGPAVIPADDVSVMLVPNEATRTIDMKVDAQPSLDPWGAGEYTSSIRVGGSGFESVTVPVSMTFRSGQRVWAAVIAIVLLALGVGVGRLFKGREASSANAEQARLNATEKAKSGATHAARRARAINLAVILTGVFTTLVVVVYGYDTQYLSNETFGSGGFSDWVALFAWGFAAGFAGKTISNFTATTSSTL
jgi:hypothetical protein